MQFATNHLGTFVALASRLQSTAAAVNPRIVSLSSRGTLRVCRWSSTREFTSRPYDPGSPTGNPKQRTSCSPSSYAPLACDGISPRGPPVPARQPLAAMTRGPGATPHVRDVPLPDNRAGPATSVLFATRRYSMRRGRYFEDCNECSHFYKPTGRSPGVAAYHSTPPTRSASGMLVLDPRVR